MRGEIFFRIVVATIVIVGAFAVGLAVWEVQSMAPSGVGPMVMENLERSGVEHPVTAVLLNFRAYDTMLEIVVLTVAFWGVWSLRVHGEPGLSRSPDLLLEWVASILVPVLIMLAVYLLWAGSHQAGGEFQAGAVLGAAGVLTLLVGRSVPGAGRALTRRIVVVAGAGVFVCIAAAGGVLSGDVFAYPQGWQGGAILLIETAAAISIGFILVALFAGSAERLYGDVDVEAALYRPRTFDSITPKKGEGGDDT